MRAGPMGTARRFARAMPSVRRDRFARPFHFHGFRLVYACNRVRFRLTAVPDTRALRCTTFRVNPIRQAALHRYAGYLKPHSRDVCT